jgi:RNA polymerase sigma factor (TIGR02999 family)
MRTDDSICRARTSRRTGQTFFFEGPRVRYDRGMDDFQEVVERARQAGQITADQLFAAFYEDIRRGARAAIRGSRPDQPLQATELVHEAYLQLRTLRGHQWQGREHFLRTAVRAVRRRLIDEIRASGAAKRGGDLQQTTLVALATEAPISLDDFIALDLALEKLRGQSDRRRRAADVLDLYFVFGFTWSEIGEIVGISVRTVRRDFRYARVWLRQEIGI